MARPREYDDVTKTSRYHRRRDVLRASIPATFFLSRFVTMTKKQFCRCLTSPYNTQASAFSLLTFFLQHLHLHLPTTMTLATRLVRTMSSVHSTTMSLRTGATPMDMAFSRQHFPKFLAATMAASGLTGYYCMEYIQQKQYEVCTIVLVCAGCRVSVAGFSGALSQKAFIFCEHTPLTQ